MRIRKKVLFCATVDYHFYVFHLPYLKWFKEQGWEVHIAAAGNMKLPYVDQKYTLPIQRSPVKKSNLAAYKELKEIIHLNQYTLIHCHTPMGGVLTRLAARSARKLQTKVMYTAHGFHFCKGAPFLNWLLYYPIERTLAYYTDCLITINQEDFQRATRHRFNANQIEYLPGVGVNTERYSPMDRHDQSILRAKYHYPKHAFLLFYAAEFNKNKNQQLLIKALALVKEQLPHAKLLLAGEGPLLKECRQLSRRLDVEDRVDFLGYRNDIASLLNICDLAVGSSIREGLPVNIMEAMACGLPIIAVDNRGHRELVINDKNGWLVGRDEREMANKWLQLAENEECRTQFGRYSRKIIVGKYSLTKILEAKSRIYKNLMREEVGEEWAVH